MPTKPSKKKTVYLERKEHGCCPRCGKKMRKNSKFIFCEDCRAYFRSYNEKISGELNEQRKMRYDLRKTEKRCPRCGKSLGKRYKNIMCQTCLDKQYKYNYGKARS